ncbi:UDP-3-O-(3-hydroxymyristoyl)glucosamine N-acyltransferase [Polycladidibacter hongkongensis]|uniref:UDP-3-O-(3-hydroxymyristoyl)glucosamine N-acyltransferase n=1 Tax=Polycladidibacter hongkongensis TaxID=1647556 RepID=UPI0008379901|nr:UDP-3-O-(3-hydroxymyristoyl)glucosamine N-acyltransferase [Pseudovibrio hongkongensis]
MTESDFFPAPTPVRVAQVAAWAGAEICRGDDSTLITHVAPLDAAGPGALVFIENPKYVDQLDETKASACLVPKKYLDRVPDGVVPLLAKQPYNALALVLAQLYPDAMAPMPVSDALGVHPKAHVSDGVHLEEGVCVEPGAVIGKGAHIGAGTHIGPNAVIGANCQIGRACRIGANAMVQHALIGDEVIIHPGVCIGQDGFGFAMGAGGHAKVPQLGRVVIQKHVEIGANTTIDRGANRDTIIGEGTKIDNQVQIGHNVQVGRHCVIVSQVGISGSSTLEDYVAIGGQSGVGGHVTIGMGAQVAAVSTVHSDLKPGGRYGGMPAKPVKLWFKELAAVRRLAERGSEK